MKASFAILLCFFIFAKAKAERPTIVFLLAEREYQTDETLPVFAKEKLGDKYIIRYCKAEDEGSNRHVLKNAGVIASADLLFVSARRRAFSGKTMGLIRKHVADGKPVLGIRTTSHAFSLRKETLPDGHKTWDEWDKKIIGGNYDGHHGGGKPAGSTVFPPATITPSSRISSFLSKLLPRSTGILPCLPSPSPCYAERSKVFPPNQSLGHTVHLLVAKCSTPPSDMWRILKSRPSTSFC